MDDFLILLGICALIYYYFFVEPARQAERRILDSQSPDERRKLHEAKTQAKTDQQEARKREILERAISGKPRLTRPEKVGAGLISIGVLGFLYYSFLETAVWVSDGGATGSLVENIGLLSRQQTGLLLSGQAIGIGVICFVFGDLGTKRER